MTMELWTKLVKLLKMLLMQLLQMIKIMVKIGVEIEITNSFSLQRHFMAFFYTVSHK